MLARIGRGRLLGHVLEGLGEALLAEGELADGPDLGILERSLSQHDMSPSISLTRTSPSRGYSGYRWGGGEGV